MAITVILLSYCFVSDFLVFQKAQDLVSVSCIGDNTDLDENRTDEDENITTNEADLHEEITDSYEGQDDNVTG